MPNNSSTAPKRNAVATILGLLGMSGIAGVLVAALVTPLIAVAGVAANSSITLFESLPDYLEIQPLQQKTELYGDLNGERTKFAEVYSQNRVEVSLDDISEYVPLAAVSTEDPRFYEHGGVDVISATRALLVGIIGDDGGGASTITMQYVRNQRVQAAEAILDPEEQAAAYKDATEISMGRKLQEMRLAIGVEQQFSKEEILQGYLNIALFGGQIYGIEAAAQYYFGKPAKDLTLSESATLVGTVQNPNAFRIDNPDNLEASTNRRNYVLGRMLDEGAITQAEYDEAKAEEITPNITPSEQGCMNAKYDTEYFCDYVEKVILNDPVFGATYEERLFNYKTKGYQIDTTVDLDLQQQVTDVVNTNLPASIEGVNFGGTAVAVQPGTGYVLAMQQNTEYDVTEAAADNPGATAVNYNTDYNYGGSSGFQPASTYKVFTLANWLQSGHSLYEQFSAADRTFDQFYQSCDRVGGNASYAPGNDAGAKFGSINAIKATQDSINTGFLAMAEKLDQCTTADIAEALGVHNANGTPLETRPSDIIGSGGNYVAPISLATAFAAIANDGETCSPTPIKALSLRDGTELEPPSSDCTQAIDPEVAHAMALAMKTVMSAGSGTASNPGLTSEIIGKTGTTGGTVGNGDGAAQTWMVAATTGFSLAVWVGNTQMYEGRWANLRTLGYGWTRHQIAQPILNLGISEYGAETFPAPTGDTVKKENVTVPDVVGMSIDAATSALESAGFEVSVGSSVSSEEDSGNIAKSNPSPGTRVPAGSTVTISPSSGDGGDDSDGIPMPDITGMDKDEATQALSEAGLGDQGNSFQWSGPEDGTVKSTTPSAGEVVGPDDTVKITAE
ncbi:transglycosylase domain-containing protein [Gulosibacter faecalis]|uniref:Transglycosylase domain-containing protein n=1 Tax=Gulosibacter faecalis TaxID=272240 RepID=A0ABW5UX84_9MICO|nr:transglycosylase domain-containing protein [Gulosibacter faecalis]